MEDGYFDGPPWGGMGGRGWAKTQMFQARRGDMRGVILNSLEERPMHGYEIIRHLEEKSHGMWRPSPGSIYPTLQLLEEEDLIIADEKSGKKIYTLTMEGKKAAEKVEEATPWTRTDFKDKHEFRALAGEIMHSFKCIARSGDPDMQARALDALRKTRDELNEIAKSNKKGDK